ncbi:MAG: hypothetical protein AAF330_01410 [Pseudomonadota bacterium]
MGFESPSYRGCQRVPPDEIARHDLPFPVLGAQRCALDDKTPGIEREDLVITARPAGLGPDRYWLVVLPLSPDGELMSARLPLAPFFAPFMLAVGTLLSLRFLGTTPGKWMVGIRLSGSGCETCRELRRQAPVFALHLVGVAMLTVPPGFVLAQLVPYNLPIILGIFALLAWYYLWPFIRWTGQHRWDRAAGLTVVKARNEA